MDSGALLFKQNRIRPEIQEQETGTARGIARASLNFPAQGPHPLFQQTNFTLVRQVACPARAAVSAMSDVGAQAGEGRSPGRDQTSAALG